MDRGNVLDAKAVHHQFVLHNEWKLFLAGDGLIAVEKMERLTACHFHASQTKLVGKTGLVGAFQQTWTEVCLDFHSRVDDLARKIIEGG